MRITLFFAALIAAVTGCAQQITPRASLNDIDTIVVIYAENRSFDHLYGLFPGANGIAQATTEQKTQIDHDGKPLPHLPPVYDHHGDVDRRFPGNLPNGPFRIDAPPINGRMDQVLPSPIHAFYQNREQINGGLNNRFVAMSNLGAWTMGYWDGSSMRLWRWAREYTLADNFFMAAFGGSYLNHQWLICACTPQHKEAPSNTRASLDSQGRLRTRLFSPSSVMNGPPKLRDGRVSPDGYTVNTSQPPYQPSGIPPAAGGSLDHADPKHAPVPPQTGKTIGDTLSAKGIRWAWYAGGWNAALADGRRDPGQARRVIYNRAPESPIFQPHHQPFNYYARFAPGTADRAAHLKDLDDLYTDIDKGTLPPVVFYKPAGRNNEHPSYTDIETGDRHLDDLLARLRKSRQWSKMAIIITYDENGGFWDHVSPPQGDRWGPGTRVPAIIISPFAKRGHVDKTQYDTTSIIQFITRRFALEPLPGVRAKMGDLTAAFDFAR
jgi:phospholipase C